MKLLLTALLVLGTGTIALSQANTKLSNLVAPTTVNASLIPNTTNTKDLGTSTLAWKDEYLRGYLYLDGTRFVSNAPGTTSYNAFVGSYSGQYITKGQYNTAVGHLALYRDTTGSYNTAVGAQALYNNTSGFNNIAIGNTSLRDNKEGYYNIAIGDQSLLYNNGSGNIAMGIATLSSSIRGRYNVAIGNNSLFVTRAAEFNTAIGSLAGNSYDNGYNNVFVGAYTDVNGPGYYNVIAIGQGTICTAPSQVTIGNPSNNSYRAYGYWSNISDGRFKRSIKEDVLGLAFITKLRPVSYTIDASGLDAFLNKGGGNNEQISAEAKAVMQKAFNEKEAIVETGFIAQEVEQTAKELNYNFSGVEAPKNDKDVYALRYAEFVVPLVKAVQELDSIIKSKDKQITSQQQQIDDLRQMLLELKNGSINNTTSNLGYLEQNTPNPVTSNTSIRYYVSQTATSARLTFTNAKGQLIKAITITNRGTGQVNLDSGMLAAGAYNYTLWVDGKKVDTKKLVLVY